MDTNSPMEAIQAYPHQGLGGLTLLDLPDPGDPGPTSIRLRVHATSLNFHDLGVGTGRLPSIDGRIPMADGAGVVEAVGCKVTEFEPGDHVVSTFFPTWLDGEAYPFKQKAGIDETIRANAANLFKNPLVQSRATLG